MCHMILNTQKLLIVIIWQGMSLCIIDQPVKKEVPLTNCDNFKSLRI